MPVGQHPFIDVAVHRQIRSRFARGEGLVLFAAELGNVLWANGRGAELFGFATPYELMDEWHAVPATVRRQLQAAASQLAGGEGEKKVTLRIASGLRSRTLSRVADQPRACFDGTPALLLADGTSAAEPRPEEPCRPHHRRARRCGHPCGGARCGGRISGGLVRSGGTRYRRGRAARSRRAGRRRSEPARQTHDHGPTGARWRSPSPASATNRRCICSSSSRPRASRHGRPANLESPPAAQASGAAEAMPEKAFPAPAADARHLRPTGFAGPGSRTAERRPADRSRDRARAG